jgi:CelD/BcsL family acetyltransferase involved in cellulose biosynthesis
MQIKVLRTIEQTIPFAEEWNNLLTCCGASHVPFLRYEYLHSWWSTLGGGEWPSGDLFVVLVSQDGGELLGIAPLFFTTNRDNLPALMLLGSIEISDYLDFIVRTSALPEFSAALLDFLDSDQTPAWQVLDLYNLPDSSPSLPALQAAAEKRGWTFSQQQIQSCPSIPLPGDWELYLSQIDKKQRHEVRRKMRRAEEFDLPVRWYIVEDAAGLESEIDDFLALMAQDPEKERFLTPLMRKQFHTSMQAAFQAGWLQLAFLEVGDQKAAGYLNFDYAGHIWVYNSGLNFSFRDLSPGWVLLGNLLKWANENQRQSFDFMRGDEDYKYRFGGVTRYVVRAQIKRPG